MNNKAHLRPSDYDIHGDIVPKYYSNWKRHIVDNGYNADWKCKKCGYIVKTDFPPVECPMCKKESEADNDTGNMQRLFESDC